ncbi:carboxypeptidase regulatory-like domain-containing protein [Micromonospora sp. NPDC047793]|uniref:carboxypeptidase-like regulatory domain-containing protein n=1 Tax=unclassified Micromonospora TaxID=2617518 RepID=UPI0010331CF8|nr:carboxypeptidase-like regulatory domain-containing protein [Verrucosispora sp. SN26_14.1]TBL31534.1 hypothetical protein EYA84_21000 [Verrucosispora sp. SN26_14.1]
MQLTLIRRAVLAGIAVVAVVAPGATPAWAADTGTISGRLTTSAGAAAPDVPVVVYRTGGFTTIAETQTDADGTYTLASLRPGSYTVGYLPPNRPEQYHRQKFRSWEADPVVVTADATTTVDEQLVATGTVTGRIVDAAGEPRSGLRVEARPIGSPNWANTVTDSDGRYAMAVLAGDYRVSFQPIEGSRQAQYVPGKLGLRSAGVFAVTADAVVVADDTVLPVGNLSGRFTTAAGAPLTEAQVDLYTPDGENAGWTDTDADGAFDLEVLAGAYRVGVFKDDRQQYYRGKLVPEQADLVTVRGGERTSITDALLGTGTLRVRAVDSVTGAPIARFCAMDACSNGTGSVIIPDIPEGRHDVYLYTPDGRYLPRNRSGVLIRADQTTEVTVALSPGATISTTVVDRQTGAPLAGVCLEAFANKRALLLDSYPKCSDHDGRVDIGPLRAGEHKLFAVPQNQTYGRQWVGPDGGTGDEREAATVTTNLGQVSTGPVVRLDRAGRVSGRVTDVQTGAGLADVHVSVLTGHPGVGAEDVRTDDQGGYTLTRLGPYAWPVVFGGDSHAAVWSGGASSRFKATPVLVTADATATLDATLSPGTQFTGTIKDGTGRPFQSGLVMAHSVDTGDIAGSGLVSGGQFDLRLTGRQRVFLSYEVSLDGVDMHSGRYRVADSDGVVRLVRFTVPATGSTSVDVVIPTS